jgi:hypothetical protein
MRREIVPKDQAPSSPPLENTDTVGIGQPTRTTASELAEFNGGAIEKYQGICQRALDVGYHKPDFWRYTKLGSILDTS